jgi:catechol 2,3-dioxygenase-like lactoylglutathione lyase family enzyme
MAMEIAHIRHVGLFTTSLDEHARFYSDVWGLDRVAQTSEAIFLRGSSSEHFILSLHQGKGRGLHHIAYAMSDDEAVRKMASLLKRARVRIVEEPHYLAEPGVGWTVH